MIYQFATAVTDLILFIECLFMAIYLQFYAAAGVLHPWPALFFFLSALGFLVGVFFHGIHNNEKTAAGKTSLFFLMSFSGAANCALGLIAGRLLFDRLNMLTWDIVWFLLLGCYLFYCLYAILKYGDIHFFYSTLLGVPAIVSLIFALPYRYAQIGNEGYLLLLSGLAVQIIAAVQQKMRIGIHPRHFDHNAVFHLFCMVGLALMFFGFKGLSL